MVGRRWRRSPRAGVEARRGREGREAGRHSAGARTGAGGRARPLALEMLSLVSSGEEERETLKRGQERTKDGGTFFDPLLPWARRHLYGSSALFILIVGTSALLSNFRAMDSGPLWEGHVGEEMGMKLLSWPRSQVTRRGVPKYRSFSDPEDD